MESGLTTPELFELRNNPLRSTFMRSYQFPFASSQEFWYAAGQAHGSAALTTAALTLNRLHVMPQYVREDTRIDALAAEVTGAGGAGSVIRLGVYDTQRDACYPGRLLAQTGPMDATGTGVKSEPVTLLMRGKRLYWFAYVAQVGTVPTIRVTPSTALSGYAGTEATMAANYGGTHYFLHSAGGPLPSPYPNNGIRAPGSAVPLVAFRVI